MELTVDHLCGSLLRSRLLSGDEIQSALRRWHDTTPETTTSASHFTRWLIRENLLTEYQASLLSKGLVDDFFLDDYKILERVGRGRMAGVYRSVRPGGQIVAVKVLPPSRARIPALLGRFQREAKLSLKFDHPNVVHGFDVGETKGLHYLVMEFLEGETAEEMLQRHKTISAKEAAHLVRQAMLGLQHLHEHDIVHRDLKPANLMLVPAVRGERDNLFGCTVKILDIGLARPLFEDSNPGLERSEVSELTQEGVLLGTPDYLSPEQARDPRAIDIRSDLYSLGCVLYHFLVGHPPFPDGNVLNQMVRHATETPKPVRDFRPELPDEIQQILNHLLAKQPAQRYPNPVKAAEALQAFLESDASKPRPSRASIPLPPTKVLKRDTTPVGRPVSPPPALTGATETTDIELEPIEDIPTEPVQLIRPPRVATGPDWVMLGLGAGGIAIVVAIGIVLSLIFR
jgi:serine/threonine-protein kinase